MPIPGLIEACCFDVTLWAWMYSWEAPLRPGWLFRWCVIHADPVPETWLDLNRAHVLALYPRVMRLPG